MIYFKHDLGGGQASLTMGWFVLILPSSVFGFQLGTSLQSGWSRGIPGEAKCPDIWLVKDKLYRMQSVEKSNIIVTE